MTGCIQLKFGIGGGLSQESVYNKYGYFLLRHYRPTNVVFPVKYTCMCFLHGTIVHLDILDMRILSWGGGGGGGLEHAPLGNF